MKSTRKIAAWLLLAALITGVLASCSKDEDKPDAESTKPETTEEVQTTALEETTEFEPGQTRPTADSNTQLEYEISYTQVHLYEISSGSVWMQAIAEIKNTGETNLSMDTATFLVKDSAGETIANKGNVLSYPRILSAREKGYFYMEAPLSGVDVNTQLTLEPQVEISKTSVVKHTFEATDTKLSTNALGDLTVTGKIHNTTDKTYETVYTATILYDEKDLPIGLIPSSASYSLVSGETAELADAAFALPDTVDEDAVASFTVLAYAISFT